MRTEASEIYRAILGSIAGLAKFTVATVLFGVLCAAPATVQAVTFTPNVFTDPDVSVTHHVDTANGHIITNPSTDTGQISLRSAVIAANATTNATISLGIGTYGLSIPGDANDRQFVSFNPNIGDLNVNASGTIIQQGDERMKGVK